jgi:hypothetical protein
MHIIYAFFEKGKYVNPGLCVSEHPSHCDSIDQPLVAGRIKDEICASGHEKV